jgi:hypothetical protein
VNVEELQTTKQLRSLLTGIIKELDAGTIDLDKAYGIVKLADEINESLLTDVREAKLRFLEARLKL